MQIDKALRREKKQHKDRYGMKIENASIFDIQAIQQKRSEKIKAKRRKERVTDDFEITEE